MLNRDDSDGDVEVGGVMIETLILGAELVMLYSTWCTYVQYMDGWNQSVMSSNGHGCDEFGACS